MAGRSDADTPPLGLPAAVAPEEEGPIIIEPSKGWMWAAIAASVVALGMAGVLLYVLVVGSGKGPGLVLVPQVTDLPWQQARIQLEEAGFVPIHQGVPRTDGVDGAVFEQDPPADSRAESGSFVEIHYAILEGQSEVTGDSPVAQTAPRPQSTPATEGSTSARSTGQSHSPPGANQASSPASSPRLSPTSAPTPESVQVADPLDPPWIAIVASPDNEDDARALFEDHYAEDYPDGGVLDSSDFSQMRDGYWLVYVGTFTTRDGAVRFCRDTFGTPSPGRQPDCYVRTTAG